MKALVLWAALIALAVVWLGYKGIPQLMEVRADLIEQLDSRGGTR